MVLPTNITTLATAIHQRLFAIAAKRALLALRTQGRIQIPEHETLIQELRNPNFRYSKPVKPYFRNRKPSKINSGTRNPNLKKLN
jgi:hypothetical protein